MKKKTGILFTVGSVTMSSLLFAVGVINSNHGSRILKAQECDVHEGYHYEHTNPTDFDAGNEEFWVCCKCHQVMLEEPTQGNFPTRAISSAVGGLDNTHPAYIAPTMDVWDGTTASAFTNGTGTVDDPYLLESAANLKFLQLKINSLDKDYTHKNYKLMTGIDLNEVEWVSIANAGATQFSGIFDGNGHNVIGLKASSVANLGGLFGHLVNATIKNLSVDGNITASAARNAILAGSLDYSVIENCTVTGQVTAAGSYCGGICAYAEALNTTVTRDTTHETAIRNCINKATVTCNATGNTFVGGIIGDNLIKLTIENCENYGHIVGGDLYVGGIAGFAHAAAGSYIKGCYNFGNVDSSTKQRPTGGIIGCSRIKVENCYGCVNVKVNNVAYNVNNLYPDFGSTVPGGVICGKLDAKANCTSDAGFINCGGCNPDKTPA